MKSSSNPQLLEDLVKDFDNIKNRLAKISDECIASTIRMPASLDAKGDSYLDPINVDTIAELAYVNSIFKVFENKDSKGLSETLAKVYEMAIFTQEKILEAILFKLAGINDYFTVVTGPPINLDNPTELNINTSLGYVNSILELFKGQDAKRLPENLLNGALLAQSTILEAQDVFIAEVKKEEKLDRLIPPPYKKPPNFEEHKAWVAANRPQVQRIFALFDRISAGARESNDELNNIFNIALRANHYIQNPKPVPKAPPAPSFMYSKFWLSSLPSTPSQGQGIPKTESKPKKS